MIGQRLSVVERWNVFDTRGQFVLFFDAPFSATETADDEQDDRNAQISERHTHPDLFGKRVHETEHARKFLDRFLNHDADTEIHEWFAKIHYALPGRVDSERCHGQIRFLSV